MQTKNKITNLDKKIQEYLNLRKKMEKDLDEFFFFRDRAYFFANAIINESVPNLPQREKEVLIKEIFSKRRGRERISDARKLCMYCVARLVPYECRFARLAILGEIFQRDHSTILYAVDEIRKNKHPQWESRKRLVEKIFNQYLEKEIAKQGKL